MAIYFLIKLKNERVIRPKTVPDSEIFSSRIRFWNKLSNEKFCILPNQFYVPVSKGPYPRSVGVSQCW
jgi:hypothetical protein